MYSLTGAATSSGPFPDGRFAYGSVFALNNVLYFTTIQGGAYNRGTIDAFNLDTNTFTKLYDLDGGTADGLSTMGQEARGGFTLVNEGGTDYLYLLTRAGGAYNSGTLLRITPIPEPGTVALILAAGAVGWRWRRKVIAPGTTARVLPPSTGYRKGRRAAFTLLELLVVMVIVGVLSGVALPVLGGFMDRGREAACLSNLRQIGAAYYSYAGDHGGYFPDVDAIGNSSYRSADDPLGLPLVFAPYLESTFNEQGKKQGTKIWLCPGGRPTLKAYGNNYAWSRSDTVTKRPAAAIVNAVSTALVWDNFTMTLPSGLQRARGVRRPPCRQRAISLLCAPFPHESQLPLCRRPCGYALILSPGGGAGTRVPLATPKGAGRFWLALALAGGVAVGLSAQETPAPVVSPTPALPPAAFPVASAPPKAASPEPDAAASDATAEGPAPGAISPAAGRKVPRRPTLTDEEYRQLAAHLREDYAKPPPEWPKPEVDAPERFREIGTLPKMTYPADNPPSQAKVDLGAMLFFDPRLSRSHQMACASCHDPDLTWADGRTTAFGNRREVLRRNTPSLLTSGYGTSFFWDGRADSLENQAHEVLLNHQEMNGEEKTVLQRLRSSSAYVREIPLRVHRRRHQSAAREPGHRHLPARGQRGRRSDEPLRCLPAPGENGNSQR